MRDGVRTGRRRLLQRGDEPPANEDFLFHLSRGSELLMHNRVVEAKEELERALEHRPRDAQSQDLLAGVYFRLGVYPTAIRLWRSLVDDFPEDSVLHVNLGLALFKTGQPTESRDHLLRALEIDPSHERAWGYLGLIYWRLGKLDLARDAFLRGGQLTMARRMEEQSSAGSIPAPPPHEPPEELPAGIEAAQVSAMRDAASAAADRLAGEVHLSVEAERPRRRKSGRWNVVETGADVVPGLRRGRATPLPAPARAGVLADQWALTLPEGTPLAVGVEGELLVRSEGAVTGRVHGLCATQGALVAEPLTRRFRGRDSDEPLGGDEDPLLRWSGPIGGVVRPADGQTLVALRVDETLLYVREELVQAFDDRVGYESGRLPLAGRPSVLLQFHGEGVVVLRLPRLPSGLPVESEQEVRVDPEALVGWTGRLFPSEAEDPFPASIPLVFKGQGVVLIT